MTATHRLPALKKRARTAAKPLWVGALIWALAGCYPGLKVVRPHVSIGVVDPQGSPVANAAVTIATFRHPFPMASNTVRATHRTDEAGMLKLRKDRQWELQILLPDGGSWYTWLYCIEKPGYRAVASAEVTDRIGPTTVLLEPSAEPSQCVWPTDQEHWLEVQVR